MVVVGATIVAGDELTSVTDGFENAARAVDGASASGNAPGWTDAPKLPHAVTTVASITIGAIHCTIRRLIYMNSA